MRITSPRLTPDIAGDERGKAAYGKGADRLHPFASEAIGPMQRVPEYRDEQHRLTGPYTKEELPWIGDHPRPIIAVGSVVKVHRVQVQVAKCDEPVEAGPDGHDRVGQSEAGGRAESEQDRPPRIDLPVPNRSNGHSGVSNPVTNGTGSKNPSPKTAIPSTNALTALCLSRVRSQSHRDKNIGTGVTVLSSGKKNNRAGTNRYRARALRATLRSPNQS